MDPAESLQRRIADLEESVRILQTENDQLAERAEETMLLSLIAEEIGRADTPVQVLEMGLERIALLKDIPLCACCDFTGGDARVIAAFLSFSHTDLRGRSLSIPDAMRAPHSAESLYVAGPACPDCEIELDDRSRPFKPHEMLLIPVSSGMNQNLLFVFGDDRPEERLPGLVMMLHRLVDMMSSKVDELELLSSLQVLNDELRSTNLALERATEAKSEFLASMSHEIRTPMNAILGFAQLMRRDTDLSPRQSEHLDVILRSGEYLMALINDILEMSKIEAGRSVANTESFDLHQLLDEISAIFSQRALDQGLVWDVELDAHLPRKVVTDKGKLRQILINLLSNALKFTPEGSVTLRATSVQADEGMRLIFDVQDTGVGIPQEELHLLFTQFQQTSSGRSSGTGTGLGLALSRKYAQLLGGDMSVSSQPGRGSTFSFNITARPADEADEPRRAPRIAEVAPGQASRRVLVADDYAEMRELVSQMLGAFGFEVHTVTNGEQAVEFFEAEHPELIFMDMRMPVMDGPRAIGEIRSRPGGQDVRIVVLTANVFADTRSEAHKLGADDFISKPFTEEELLETLGRLLDVEYVRETLAEPADESDLAASEVAVPDAAAANVNATLAAAIRDATRRADFDRVTELAVELEAHDTALARQIERLAVVYNAERILALLDERAPTD